MLEGICLFSNGTDGPLMMMMMTTKLEIVQESYFTYHNKP